MPGPRYLALGDSISIDQYTGVSGGGAVSQFAHLIGADQVQDLTVDGCRTIDALDLLPRIEIEPDVVTVTLGGNDLIEAGFYRLGSPGAPSAVMVSVDPILERLGRIYAHLGRYNAEVIANTVYDPTDGDDARATDLGLDPSARNLLHALNQGIRDLTASHRFLLCDIHDLFLGHGSGARSLGSSSTSSRTTRALPRSRTSGFAFTSGIRAGSTGLLARSARPWRSTRPRSWPA